MASDLPSSSRVIYKSQGVGKPKGTLRYGEKAVYTYNGMVLS